MALMARKTERSARRSEALSSQQIVAAAVELLDRHGEGALTFRALATRLDTGAGALYWHVANKDELLAAATDAIVSAALDAVAGRNAKPRPALRALAGALFDAIDAHPWIGTQLAREPWQPAAMQIFERVGQQLQALGVRKRAQFDCASALLGYLLGLASQYAASARLLPPDRQRSAFLARLATRWTDRDPALHPFVHAMAPQLRDHDDRAQFLAGFELILAGIETVC